MGSLSLPSNGVLPPQATWGQYNSMKFMVQQLIAKLQTATLVRVESCTNDGGLSPFGFVDVVPMVNQVDANGNPQPHTTIYNVPYLRIQGGANAIIIDPQEGDIGIAIFASRDLTKVKNTQAPANPGSARQYDFSDALYLGGLLNGIPEQYIQFNDEGISIVSPDNIAITAPSISIGDGGSLAALMTGKFLTYFTTAILPFLQGLGYTGAAPPADSVTTTVQGQ